MRGEERRRTALSEQLLLLHLSNLHDTVRQVHVEAFNESQHDGTDGKVRSEGLDTA